MELRWDPLTCPSAPRTLPSQEEPALRTAGPRSCPARAAPALARALILSPALTPVLPPGQGHVLLTPAGRGQNSCLGFVSWNHVLNPEGGVQSTFTNSTAISCPGTCSILRLALSTRDRVSSVPACSEEGYCYAPFRVRSWSSGGPTPQGERSRTARLNQAAGPRPSCSVTASGPRRRLKPGRQQDALRNPPVHQVGRRVRPCLEPVNWDVVADVVLQGSNPLSSPHGRVCGLDVGSAPGLAASCGPGVNLASARSPGPAGASPRCGAPGR